MSKVFKLSKRGLTRLMKSAAIQGILNGAAAQIAAKAGDGFEVESAHPIRWVAIASVRTGSYKARLRNSQEKALDKAVGSVKI